MGIHILYNSNEKLIEKKFKSFFKSRRSKNHAFGLKFKLWTHLFEAGLAWVQISRPQQNNLIFTQSQFLGIGKRFVRAAMDAGWWWWPLKIFYLPSMTIKAWKRQEMPETEMFTFTLLLQTTDCALSCVVDVLVWSLIGGLACLFSFFADLWGSHLKLSTFWKIGPDGSQGSNQSGRLALSGPFFLQNENQTDPYTFPPDRK